MEFEFLAYVLSNLTTVGLDDNVADMGLLKTEKANIAALKESCKVGLLQVFDDPELRAVIDEDEMDLAQLFKVNPKKNKGLWCVNFPLLTILLLA
jgi:hypothetical protein